MLTAHHAGSLYERRKRSLPENFVKKPDSVSNYINFRYMEDRRSHESTSLILENSRMVHKGTI